MLSIENNGANHLPLQLAVDLAARFNGEIVNADAMQMYRGLPIITNKISLEEQRSVPHHLLGNIALDEETWVVGVFKREATRIIQEIRNRGRLPIIVGGTHYYTKALLFKDSLVASEDESSSDKVMVRDNSAEHPILDDSTEAMWKKLKEVDPIMAERWHPNDRRKIRRSLEIFLTTGRRASDIYEEQQKRKLQQAISENDDSCLQTDPLFFWVHSEDQVLKDRLNKRVDKMLESGLMDEIKEMNNYLQSKLQAGEPVDFSRGIWQSIGFKEFRPYLQALENHSVTNTELEQLKMDCLEIMKRATRRYAKYQVKWIPKQMMPLLEEQGNIKRLYVLDSTDVSQYGEQVLEQAAALTQKFLDGEDMPSPSDISGMAQDVLNAAMKSASTSQGTSCRRYCQFCDATLLTEEGWQKHIRGRAHRRQARHAKRTALVPVEDIQAETVAVEANLPSSDSLV